jgi:TonB family protein
MSMRVKTLLVVISALSIVLPLPCRAWNDMPTDLKKILLYGPEPEYPMALARKGIGGEGKFRLTIDPRTGQVTEVKVLRSTGFTILNELAAKAFLQWRFRPGITKQETITYEFHVIGYGRELH